MDSKMPLITLCKEGAISGEASLPLKNSETFPETGELRKLGCEVFVAELIGATKDLNPTRGSPLNKEHEGLTAACPATGQLFYKAGLHSNVLCPLTDNARRLPP